MTGDKLMGQIGVILAAWKTGAASAEQARSDLKILFERVERRPAVPARFP